MDDGKSVGGGFLGGSQGGEAGQRVRFVKVYEHNATDNVSVWQRTG